MSEEKTFSSSSEAKREGQFSRRHRTNAEHLKAQAEYRANRGPEARKRRALERKEAADASK